MVRNLNCFRVMAVNTNFLTKLRVAVQEMFIILFKNSIITYQLFIIMLKVTSHFCYSSH
jgi:hypothetical protein